VINASVYIAVCTAKNRLLVRLRRLREPRYLVGAVVGVAYLYFAVFARGRRPGVRFGRNGRPQPADFGANVAMAGTSLGGLTMLVLAALAWVTQTKSALLEFSQAEIAFLFPAPATRRQLLVHRMIRSQIGSLIGSAFIALFATPFSGLGRARLAVSIWAVMLTMRVYYAAVLLTRARLRSSVAAERRAAWIPVGGLLGAVAVVSVSVARELLQPISGASDFFVHLARATSSGPASVVLWPFMAILRPPFAATTQAFLSALAGSVLVLAAVTAWMLLGDGMFDEVAGQGGAARDLAPGQAAAAPSRARGIGWTLPLTGRPELALLWKGAMETFRGVSARAVRLAIPLLVGVGGAAFGIMGANGMRGAAAAVSVIGGIVAAVSVVFGPQLVNSDLRTDLGHLEVLKTWPMRAADVIRGEMAWPVLLVSSVMCVSVAIAALFSTQAVPNVPFVSRWSYALAAVVAGPALVAAQFVVHNTAAILFPAWVQLGTQRTRGIDAMGQRLITLAAVVLSLAAFAIPGALAGGVIWLIFHRLVGDVVYVPAAVAFAIVVLIEVVVATELLGPAYERIDLSSIEKGES